MARTYRRHHDYPFKGKKFRDGTGQSSMAHTPSEHVRYFMNVPKRRKNKKLCHSILKGSNPANIVWPLGNKKPHEYYW